MSRHRGTPFWQQVIQALPRGAWIDPHDANFIYYTLEGSLWMLYYEVLTHLYTIQRLKRAQGLEPGCVLPRVGYLTLPEYTGETASAGASLCHCVAATQSRLRSPAWTCRAEA